MKIDILIKYRDKDQELDLLGALEHKGLNQYNDEYKKLIEILLTMLSITKKNSVPIQQYLFRSIYSVIDEILRSKQSIEEFTNIIATSVNEENDNVTSFVFRFILNIKDNVEGVRDKDNIQILKENLERINIKALQVAIENDEEYSLILKLFYNCVNDMESDRRVILHPEAIKKFRAYIENNPMGYLQHFVRPYFTGPTKGYSEFYLHVGEPFCSQLFPNNTFEQFLNNIEDINVDPKLVEDIREFYRRAHLNSKNKDKTVFLFSPEYNPSYSVERLKLQYEDHEYVRTICLPPEYKDSNE